MAIGWRSSLVIGLLLFCSGCQWLSGLSDEGAEVKPYLPILAPDPEQPAIAVVQRVTGQRKGKTYTLLSQWEIEPQRLAMVASTGGGSSLFSLLYQGSKLHTEVSPLVPVALDPLFVMADFQLAFWPVAVLKGALRESPYELLEINGERQLFKGKQMLVSITYGSRFNSPFAGFDQSIPTPWSSVVVFNNWQWGYQYRIETLSVELLKTNSVNDNSFKNTM